MNMKTFTRVAMIAAVYTVVSLLLAPFSYGNVQVRIAEALTLLPLIYKPSIWGVTLGCFLTNLIGAMMGVNPTGFIDAIVGTIATFGAAYCTWLLKDKKIFGIPVLAALMPVVFNFFIVGLELAYLFMPNDIIMGTLINGAWVAIGEVISVIFGYFLVQALQKTKLFEE
ncbi:MAG: QueT transporter family protein [Erysipelotrichaceae bacterium]|nr:QueT transporter family protein [Erysipelotrichaceae bacterium]MDY6034142.1 QueT transporter family protein [Bulleidia sp.]